MVMRVDQPRNYRAGARVIQYFSRGASLSPGVSQASDTYNDSITHRESFSLRLFWIHRNDIAAHDDGT
jgi:hypothetical protein